MKWIVYYKKNTGVTSFDGTLWKTYTQLDGLVSNRIQTVKVGENNVKWFISYDQGVSSFDGTT